MVKIKRIKRFSNNLFAFVRAGIQFMKSGSTLVSLLARSTSKAIVPLNAGIMNRCGTSDSFDLNIVAKISLSRRVLSDSAISKVSHP